eukprot:1149059-Pelagomonas_calceolata.AAC.2
MPAGAAWLKQNVLVTKPVQSKNNISQKLSHSISGMQTRTWLILGFTRGGLQPETLADRLVETQALPARQMAYPKTSAWFMKSLKCDALLGGAELNS